MSLKPCALEAFVLIVAPDGYEVRHEQRVVISPALRVRQEFEQYLLRERGLAAASIRLYGDSVGRSPSYALRGCVDRSPGLWWRYRYQRLHFWGIVWRAARVQRSAT